MTAVELDAETAATLRRTLGAGPLTLDAAVNLAVAHWLATIGPASVIVARLQSGCVELDADRIVYHADR